MPEITEAEIVETMSALQNEIRNDPRIAARTLLNLLEGGVPVIVSPALEWFEILVGAQAGPDADGSWGPGDELTITVGELEHLGHVVEVYTAHLKIKHDFAALLAARKESA